MLTDDLAFAAEVARSDWLRVRACVSDVALCYPLMRTGGVEQLFIKLRNPDQPEVIRLIGFVALNAPNCRIRVIGECYTLRQKAMELGVDLDVVAESTIQSLPVLGGSSPATFRPAAAGGVGQSMVLPQQFITVWSPKGGVGKTFLACNLAVVLSQLTGQATLLVDMDWDSADASVYLELGEGRTVLDVLPLLQGDKKPLLAELACKVSGCPLLVLPGPFSPELSELVNPANVRQIMDMARREFGVVIADLPPHGYNETICECLEASSRIVLLTTQDVAALRQALGALRLLKRMGIDVASRVFLVVNKFSKESPVSLQKAEDFLGVRAAACISDYRREAEASALKGVPLVLDQPKLEISLQMRKLACALLGITDREKQQGGVSVIAKWFGKRQNEGRPVWRL